MSAACRCCAPTPMATSSATPMALPRSSPVSARTASPTPPTTSVVSRTTNRRLPVNYLAGRRRPHGQRLPRRHRAQCRSGRRRGGSHRYRRHRRRQHRRDRTRSPAIGTIRHGPEHSSTTTNCSTRHFITGDGRGNENIGLTAVHHVFHSEHNRQVDAQKLTILRSGDVDFINEWLVDRYRRRCRRTSPSMSALDQLAYRRTA